MAQWTDGRAEKLSLRDCELEYACWGPAPEQAPTLVLLHEGLGSLGLWKGFGEGLANATGLGVCAFSRAGYGRSSAIGLPRPLDYMTREAQDVLPQVLDALGVRRAILLGHSDGASIAAIYAGSVSDRRVRGLILIAPHFFTETQGLAAIRAAQDNFTNGGLRARLARHHNDPDGAFRGWANAWLDPGFADWNIADVIDHWRIPVLAIQGRDDPYGTLAQIDEIDSRIYAPLETVILQGCGHAPHLECAEETQAAIVDFCARLTRIEAEQVRLDGL